MGFMPYYFAVKYEGGPGKVFITHFTMPAGLTAQQLKDFTDILEGYYSYTKTIGGVQYPRAAKVVSVSQSLIRKYARQRVGTNYSDLTNELPRLATGRAFWTDTTPTPNKTYTRPWILRGLDPTNTTRPSSITGTGGSYESIYQDFLKKYMKVEGHTPDSIEQVKNVPMN